jgi:hypothetical protein
VRRAFKTTSGLSWTGYALSWSLFGISIISKVPFVRVSVKGSEDGSGGGERSAGK